MRGDAAITPWEMPGLDALEAGPGTTASESPAPPTAPRAAGRAPRPGRPVQMTVAGVVALMLLALVPTQTGAAPAQRVTAPATSGSTSAPNATTASAVRVTITADTAASDAPGQPARSPDPDAALAVLDLPAGQPGSDATATAVVASHKVPPASAVKAAAVVPQLGATATPAPAPQPASARQVYKKDLYDGALVRYQNPDGTACTATATELMLNFIARRGSPGDGFAWSPTISYGEQETILAWERANDTLDAGALGSDPHGWRNALNYFGWRDFSSPGSRHYEDLAYSSFAAAVKAAVVAIATESQPVGILAWAGGHAQIMTGYEVYGLDPAVSSDFVVQAVYLTDPLARDRMLDTRISYADLQTGPTSYRFQPYTWSDSAADDPYMPGDTPSYTEWLGNWVIVAPIGAGSAAPGVAGGAVGR